MELTSHGFVVIADGAPAGTGAGSLGTDGTALTQAIDWATGKMSDRAGTPIPGWLAGVDGRACYEVLDAPLDVGPCLGDVFFWAHCFLGTLGAEAHF